MKTRLTSKLGLYGMHILAAAALVLSMNGRWQLAAVANAAPGPTTSPSSVSASGKTASVTAAATAPDADALPRTAKKQVTGKLNLNTATEDQLMLLPTVGPAKAERVVVWRKKNGAFKRTADLRRVKGFGYKTFKRLEPFLDIKGDSTLAPMAR